MKNNNVIPKILGNDLIKIGEKIFSIRIADKAFLKNFNKGDAEIKDNVNKLYYEYYVREALRYSLQIKILDNTLENITAIYRKVGKDYICIWEKI